MKNSSEKKKSQTRSSLMKTINNNINSYGAQIVSIRRSPGRTVYYLNAWPGGTCTLKNTSESRPCWNWNQLTWDQQITVSRYHFDSYTIYTSLNADSSSQTIHDQMLNDNIGRWAPSCGDCVDRGSG